jgi:hypothetical protein
MPAEVGEARRPLGRGSSCSGGSLVPPLLKPFVEPETVRALAPFFGEHLQFLVEAVRDFFVSSKWRR